MILIKLIDWREIMTNLIKNCRWLQGSCTSPACFTLRGNTTYDSLCVNGCRTCSATRGADSGECPIITYDELIPVWNPCCKLLFGCTARAAECECCMLVVECIDCAGVVISKERRNISCRVCGCFNTILEQFKLPRETKCCRLSIASSGTLSAFTCYAPTACFC
jgi:hypothetical protein